MKTAFEELGPAFERETGYRLKLAFGPSLQLEKRLAEGEAADVAIVTQAGAQDLIAKGRALTGSLADLARSFIGSNGSILPRQSRTSRFTAPAVPPDWSGSLSHAAKPRSAFSRWPS